MRWRSSGRRTTGIAAGIRASREGVTVVAHFGVDVEVVQNDELTGECVGVGRHVLTEEERGVAVPATEIAEHLVVRAILANHVEQVLVTTMRSSQPPG